MQKRRVACTGFGVVTPFGKGPDILRENIFNMKHGFKKVSSFDTTTNVAKFAGESPAHPRSYRSYLQYSVDAALAMAKLDRLSDRKRLENASIAVGNLGDGLTKIPYYSQFSTTEAKQQSISSHFDVNGTTIDINDQSPFAHADNVAHYIGSRKPPVAFTNACVASANAIGYGCDQIRFNRTDCAVVGGVNVMHQVVYNYFDSSRAMADDVVRPFSKDRTGLLIGDGAAILILEDWDTCKARGAEPIAELLGWGLSADGFHVLQPTPDGRGLGDAMQAALKDAQCQPDDIDYINAHGTGTPLNDRSETRAIKRVFGEKTTVPISSTKALTGHMLEATGGVEAILSMIALQDQRIPPTANYLGPEEGLDLDYVTEGARKSHLNIVLSNSCAFGGNNCSLIFRKCA